MQRMIASRCFMLNYILFQNSVRADVLCKLRIWRWARKVGDRYVAVVPLLGCIEAKNRLKNGRTTWSPDVSAFDYVRNVDRTHFLILVLNRNILAPTARVVGPHVRRENVRSMRANGENGTIESTPLRQSGGLLYTHILGSLITVAETFCGKRDV